MLRTVRMTENESPYGRRPPVLPIPASASMAKGGRSPALPPGWLRGEGPASARGLGCSLRAPQSPAPCHSILIQSRPRTRPVRLRPPAGTWATGRPSKGRSLLSKNSQASVQDTEATWAPRRGAEAGRAAGASPREDPRWAEFHGTSRATRRTKGRGSPEGAARGEAGPRSWDSQGSSGGCERFWNGPLAGSSPARPSTSPHPRRTSPTRYRALRGGRAEPGRPAWGWGPRCVPFALRTPRRNVFPSKILLLFLDGRLFLKSGPAHASRFGVGSAEVVPHPAALYF